MPSLHRYFYIQIFRKSSMCCISWARENTSRFSWKRKYWMHAKQPSLHFGGSRVWGAFTALTITVFWFLGVWNCTFPCWPSVLLRKLICLCFDAWLQALQFCFQMSRSSVLSLCQKQSLAALPRKVVGSALTEWILAGQEKFLLESHFCDLQV